MLILGLEKGACQTIICERRESCHAELRGKNLAIPAFKNDNRLSVLIWF